MIYKPQFFILFVLFSVSSLTAQIIDYSADMYVQGIGFTQEESPFWLHSNTRGRVDEKTNYSGWINGRLSYQVTPDAHFDFGAGFLYHNGYTNKVQLDESYFSFQNKWLEAVVGRKQRKELYHGLSASNENILWSLNARPLPGIRLDIIKPIYIWKQGGLAFTASLEEYITDDEDRYINKTRVHHKSFHLIFNKIRKFELIIGLQHFVQWAGISEEYGKLPSGFNDYLNVFAGKEGSNTVNGEEANALGNHMGSYEATIKTEILGHNVELIYNSLFEDNSGLMLRNTPDGRYGIFVEGNKPDGFVNAFMYEFYYTKNQSKNFPTSDGIDNYFNNNLYQSGWTYEHRVLGVPFITLDEERFRIANNKILVHHFGVSGLINHITPYKFLTSYRINDGGKTGVYHKDYVWSSYLELGILQYQDFVDVNLQLATDFNTIAAPNFGVGIQIHKNLF